MLDGIRVEYHSKNALTKTFLPKNCNQKIDTNFTPPYDLSYKFIYAGEFTKFKHNYPKIFLRNTYINYTYIYYLAFISVASNQKEIPAIFEISTFRNAVE